MQPGHEQCPHEVTVFQAWGTDFTRETVQCGHAHRDPIQADDGLGTGLVIGHYCHCCDTIERTPSYR